MSSASRANKNDFTHTLPLGRGVAIITCDLNGLIALNKPAGTLSHPNDSKDQPRSLLTARYHPEGEYYEWHTNAATGEQAFQPADGSAAPSPTIKKPNRFYLLNRLDSATSGVILGATTEQLAREIRTLFREKHISKTYAALVFGNPSEKKQIWRDILAVQKRGGQIRTAAHTGNIPAESHMTLLRNNRSASAASGGPLSLIQLEPKTGRSHQLRVQCTKRHLPIVGDATYGDFRANREFAKRNGEKRLFLHSLETHFEYTHNGRPYAFRAKAELPEAFTAHL